MIRRLLQRLGQWMGWVAASGLLATGISAVVHAHLLQSELDRGHALGVAQRALADPLERSDEAALLQVARGLFNEPSLGFSFLAVRGLDDTVRVSFGRYENLPVPWLSPAVRHRLRDALYRFTSTSGQQAVRRGTERLGVMEYAVSRDFISTIESDAVDRLRWVGLAGALLSLPLLLALWLQLRTRPARHRDAQMRQRLHPATDGAVPARMRTELVQLDGALLDRLGLAQIVADADGRLISLNATAVRCCGWAADEVERRPVYTVFHAVDVAGGAAEIPLEKALESGADQPVCNGYLKPRHGPPMAVEMMAALLHNADGVTVGAVQLFRDRSADQQDVMRLQAELTHAEAVIDHLEEGVLVTDGVGLIRSANQRAQQLFGYSREALEGVTLSKLMPVPFLNTPGIRLDDFRTQQGASSPPRVVGWRRDATTFPVDLRVQPLAGDSGLRLVTVRDITERLRRDNLAKRFERLLDHALDEVFVFDAQTLLFDSVNRGARRNLGYSLEQLQRMTPLMLASDLSAEQLQVHLNALRGGQVEAVTYRTVHQRADGSGYPVEVRLDYSPDERPPVFIMVASNISARLAVEARLQAEARHDTLTGLPNRAMLADRLQAAMDSALRTGRSLAVLFLDLDHFKQINDTLGHALGDQVLVQVSERLLGLVRRSDTVARLGGDEFVIVAQHLHGSSNAVVLADKILAAFSRRLPIQGHDLVLSLSIGIALYPQDDTDVDGLLQHADQAMYLAKQQGRSGYVMHAAPVSPERRRRADLEQGLPAALALDQLQLGWRLLQTAGGEVRALLAEACWAHPRQGSIAPEALRQVARAAGRVGELELWTLAQASAALRRLPPATEGWLILVPVSAWQLRDSAFLDPLGALLERSPAVRARLVLLLHAASFTAPVAALCEAAAALRARGVGIGLRRDDDIEDPHPLAVDVCLESDISLRGTSRADDVLRLLDPGLTEMSGDLAPLSTRALLSQLTPGGAGD
ncbi:diguanylate cyclase [Flagellatimonas centrodinii]|uniref:sensor domain-containing protein n=1 Tax=Flagellatimonas centrodinii TaxID=2806210 RepID=UPI001FEFE058|nr:diguanylate cyclase [Flagellatimonas centrodinii]ULQ45358.1 diguanylate cyclase [Flagellatimonas centrodinii]